MIWFLTHFTYFRINYQYFPYIDLFHNFVEYTWALHVSKSKRGTGVIHVAVVLMTAALSDKMKIKSQLFITECRQKSFDCIFILSDKAAFMSTTATIQPKPLFAPKAPPAGREWICIFNNKSISSNMFLLAFFLHFLIFFFLTEALLFQSVRIISLCYSLKILIKK